MNREITKHVISFGAGVQSTVMLLMADLEIITPRPEAAIFADTGWEPDTIYRHIEWMKTVCTIPIITVSSGKNLYNDTMKGVGKSGTLGTPIPVWMLDSRGNIGINKRECTTDYKIVPITKQIRELIGRKTRARTGPAAIQWLGITTDESHRIKDSRHSWITNRWPLIEINLTRSDCIQWFNKNYPGQPLVKSSCVGCPFHSDREWLRLYHDNPDQMQKAIELDEQIREPQRMKESKLRNTPFLHRTATPLREKIEQLERIDRSGQQLPLFDGWGNECEGHCGV